MSQAVTARSIVQWAEDIFTPETRRRGDEYVRRGAVASCAVSRGELVATVQGSMRYTVRMAINRSRGALGLMCNCPYCDEWREPCKHIWAVMRVAGKNGQLAQLIEVSPVSEIDSIELHFTNESGGFHLDHDEEEADEDELDHFDDEQAWPGPVQTAASGWQPPALRSSEEREAPSWNAFLDAVIAGIEASGAAPAAPGSSSATERALVYFIDLAATRAAPGIVMSLRWCRGGRIESGPRRLTHDDWARLDAVDRGLISLLLGPEDIDPDSPFDVAESIPPGIIVPVDVQQMLIRMMCETGRAVLRGEPGSSAPQPIAWDDGPPWSLALVVAHGARASCYTLRGELRRGEARMALDEPLLLTAGGVLFAGTHAARLDHRAGFAWISALRRTGPIEVPLEAADDLLARLHQLPAGPVVDLPEVLQVERVEVEPVPCITLSTNPRWRSGERLYAEVAFDYDGRIVQADDERPGIFDVAGRRHIVRRRDVEEAAFVLLFQLGVRTIPHYQRQDHRDLEIDRRRLDNAVRTIAARGWRLEVDGRAMRGAGAMRLDVRSGIDWFELHGAVDFDGHSSTLPELLAALRKGATTIALDDGSEGVLPDEWLKKYAPIAGFGAVHDGHVRFGGGQAALLDALLAARPEVTADAAFERARAQLARFEGVRPCTPAPEFRGKLRPYQREGLGWLHFLRDFGLGGCLADDMGLGKTIQVLALLEARRAARCGAANGAKPPGPSLVVVPRSLVHHWQSEAARFAPGLRVCDHSGADRLRRLDPPTRKTLAHFHEHDLVITTYGTLRRDAPLLSSFEFDYVILDEAQAIKNPDTASAKAARLLRAEHRLALSGTPVENHLGELFSLFAFLQPGLFGGEVSGRKAAAATGDDDACRIVAGAVRPFILRRTKDQVAKDLPPKVEQELLCELGPKQRRQYDELRDHFRSSLLSRVDRDGLARSKMHVLEALLRLRQLACHPALLDPKQPDTAGAKIEMLMEELEVAIDGGHKALVFSQFTKLLAIVRRMLDRKGICYEYLDGRTRDRAARVERFQSDSSCSTFLISLKAGGTGLNLTAADYVFLLDPWWNPAVEAQAIDRTHRIGQTRHVFAYKLIARDTVEQHILELQQRKRALVEAIMGNTTGPLRDLTREDLERILS